MAWVSISNTAIDQDSPITVSLMTALRDNPAAIANGDAGAPKVQTAGIQDLAVSTAKIANGGVTNGKIATGAITIDKFAAPSAASTYVLHRWREVFGDDRSSSHVFTVTRTGAFRINVHGDPANTVTVTVNSTAVATLSTFTETEAQSYDVSLNAGDTLMLTQSSISDVESSYTVWISCSQPFPFFLLRTSGWA